MRFTVLGPVGVATDDRWQAVPRAQTRALFALLMLNAGRPMSLGVVVESLWGGSAPPTARAQVHGSIHAIRKLLAELGTPDAVESGAFGYQLAIEPLAVDAILLDQQVHRARQAADSGDALEAVRLLRDGLSLWRGEPLSDAAGAFVEATRARLVERRLSAVDTLAELELRLGRHADLVAELEPVVSAYPLRESLRGHLMLALYRSGRQVEALQSYRAYRQLLADEEGLDPGQQLAELGLAILRRDGWLAAPTPGSSTAAAVPAPSPSSPVTPASVVPALLPADVSAFTGRADELARLDALAPDGGADTAVAISVIAGSAGVGKTALAVHWGHRMRDRYVDGQLYIDLRGYSHNPALLPIEALTRLLFALGVPADQVPVDVEAAAALYRSLLANRKVFVLLDNAQHADQVRPLLPAGPGCLVVVTSRDRLTGLVAREGARRITLDVLSPKEAHALLIEVLGAERVAAEPGAAEELCGLCAHLPLALRIAAASLAGQYRRTLVSYTQELRQGDRLDALEVAGDAQAAVRGTFDLSYRTLPVPAQRLFRLIGLVPGPDITRDVAAALVDGTPEQAEQLLDVLSGAHLLNQYVGGRYLCHDLLRIYAAERTADEPAADRSAAVHRLHDSYLHSVDAAARILYPHVVRLPVPERDGPPPVTFADRPAALSWLDSERPNLVAAVRQAAHGPERPAAWQLADAMRGYFWICRQFSDWFTTASAGLSAATAQDDDAGQAAAHLSLGIAHRCLSRYAEAAEHLDTALQISRRIGWTEIEATTLGSLGVSYAELGQLHQAVEHLTAALWLNRATGRRGSEAVSLGNLGNIRLEMGALAEAVESLTAALALYREIGSPGGEAITLSTRGNAFTYLGRFAEAGEDLARSVELHEQIGDRYGQPIALSVLADLYCVTGRFGPAAECATTALTVARETREHRTEAGALIVLGAAERGQGNARQAVAHYAEALRLAETTGNLFGRTAAEIGLAAAHHDASRPGAARDCANRARTTAQTAGYAVLEGQALTVLADIHLTQGDLVAAAGYARTALVLHRQTGYRPGEAQVSAILDRADSDRAGATRTGFRWS